VAGSLCHSSLSLCEDLLLTPEKCCVDGWVLPRYTGAWLFGGRWLRSEARNAWRITHPNVIKLKDILFSPQNEWVYRLRNASIPSEILDEALN
jgi:hypothetical protein